MLSRECCLLICVERLRIRPQLRFAIMRHLYYPRCKTMNRWCSFDAHFHNGAGSMSLLLSPIQEANTSVMTSCNHCPHWLPRMQDLKLLTLRSRSLLGWGRERSTTYFEHRGGQFIHKEHRCTIVKVLRFTLRYLNPTKNRTTRNAKPDIGPDESAETCPNCRVDGYGAGFGPPGSSGWGSWTVSELNRTVFLVQTRTTGGLPGPIATTRYVGTNVNWLSNWSFTFLAFGYLSTQCNQSLTESKSSWCNSSGCQSR